ncbi:hypothetical protein K502DRAFT_353980 [Neoconidiobolus thromboides FSU 785]|nr:hypothetical protein K502DRAFT_353980 [Neoconidiobolus thromboides FSU 785]
MKQKEKKAARFDIVTLNDLKLKVGADTTIALIEPPGFSKSTAIGSIERFCSVNSGSITINSVYK